MLMAACLHFGQDLKGCTCLLPPKGVPGRRVLACLYSALTVSSTPQTAALGSVRFPSVPQRKTTIKHVADQSSDLSSWVQLQSERYFDGAPLWLFTFRHPLLCFRLAPPCICSSSFPSLHSSVWVSLFPLRTVNKSHPSSPSHCAVTDLWAESISLLRRPSWALVLQSVSRPPIL